MNWVKLILQMVLYALIILVGYNVLKHFVLSKIKVKINKWIIFALAIIVLILPNILAGALHINVQNNALWVYGPSTLFIVLFLWFIDLSGWNTRLGGKSSNRNTTSSYGKKNKKDNIVIKPKAKPNRAKNNKE